MREGIELFNSERYWECHEALEDIWLEDRGEPARYVYWAVIQIACCLLHSRDGNLAGAEGMLEKSKDKFRRWEKEEPVNHLLEHNLHWFTLSQMVFAISRGAPLEQYRPLHAFRFREPEDWEYHP